MEVRGMERGRAGLKNSKYLLTFLSNIFIKIKKSVLTKVDRYDTLIRYPLAGVFFSLFGVSRPAISGRSKSHDRSLQPQSLRRIINMRVKITLACTECKQRNYNTFKNKKNDPDRIEFNKYCRFCRKHTLHREAK